jgi:hypothetical protein
MTIGWLYLSDDVDVLHIKIDKLNNLLVGFSFIRNIDRYSLE